MYVPGRTEDDCLILLDPWAQQYHSLARLRAHSIMFCPLVSTCPLFCGCLSSLAAKSHSQLLRRWSSPFEFRQLRKTRSEAMMGCTIVFVRSIRGMSYLKLVEPRAFLKAAYRLARRQHLPYLKVLFQAQQVMRMQSLSGPPEPQTPATSPQGNLQDSFVSPIRSHNT